ncbi:hypothetical protein [Shewanella sp. UCD-KL12]|uniref:hypothetical protein n=1 Tax=Shewanella sp. UCD-KL12 TaxID=1917163 RepID=UPI0009707551|nr:hypothetical protein [Shewanella sp. UCD-KL12]
MTLSASSRQIQIYLPLLIALLFACLLAACGGGGANSSDEKNTGNSSSTHEFNAQFINLIQSDNTQTGAKVDLFYQHIGIDEIEVASNVDYLSAQKTAQFGWSGLSQANLSFIIRDSFNNQSLISKNTMSYSSAQQAHFLIATGEKPSTHAVSVFRVNKLTEAQSSYRLFHANALDSRNIDIYNADTQTAILTNLAFNQLSAPIKFDPNIAQSNIFVIPTGTTPDYTNTADYLLQAVIAQESSHTLSVLIAKPGTASGWQLKHYPE